MYTKTIQFQADGEPPYNGMLFVRWDHKEELWKVVIVIWIPSAVDETMHYVEHEAESFEDIVDAGNFISCFGYPEAAEFLESIEFGE